jgi:hypothetical protein
MTERALLHSEQPSDMDPSWLACLKPGDEVIVQENGHDIVAAVYQRLPSGKIVVGWADDTREFNFDGRLCTSGTYSSTFLVEPTAYRKAMIEKQDLARYLAQQPWHQLPVDTLRQIAALVQGD